MKNLLFLDTETTGTKKENGIIQLGAFLDRVNNINDIEPLEKFNYTCNIYEGELIEEGALKANGHKKEEIANYENPKKVFAKVDSTLRKYYRYGSNLVLVAYNARFDYEFMERWYDKGSPINSKGNPEKRFFYLIGAEVIDMATLIVDLFLWNNIKLENYKLSTIAPYFKIAHKAHDAYSDIEVTRELFYRYKRYQLLNLPFNSLFEPFQFKKEELLSEILE